MSTRQAPSNPRILATLAVMLAVAFAVGPLAADSVYRSGVFELGDGVVPAVPGIADIAGSDQPGPDWEDLFRAGASHGLRDDFNELGKPVANGVPDFLEAWPGTRLRRDAAFVADPVSAGVATDGSVPAGPGLVAPGIVDPGYDLSNAYAYMAFSPSRDLMLFLAAERLSNADAAIVFEFNRDLFAVDADGRITGLRSSGDLRIEASFASGVLSSVALSTWEGGWVLLDTLPIDPSQPSEQCNAGETLCAVCNGVTIEGGGWTKFDGAGKPTAKLTSETFLEMGINLSALVGVHTWQNFYATRYTSVQVSSHDAAGAPADYALGTFVRAASLAK